MLPVGLRRRACRQRFAVPVRKPAQKRRPSVGALAPETSMSWVRRCSVSPASLSTGARVDATQSSGSAAKSCLALLYHPIPETGCFHLPFISFKARSCVASPCATTSLRCLSCAFMTSSAVCPGCGKSQGPPNCLHVIVFIGLAPSRRSSSAAHASSGSRRSSASMRSQPAFAPFSTPYCIAMSRCSVVSKRIVCVSFV